ncbi:MAG: hypothetical protein ORN98_03790 [Alphaproteobacteria bacterium]|nr:hypothetical protein [Alphaproteobacteria bacterium]
MIKSLRDDLARIFGTCISASLVALATAFNGHLDLTVKEYVELIAGIIILAVFITLLRKE